jgi:hypothetical protein
VCLNLVDDPSPFRRSSLPHLSRPLLKLTPLFIWDITGGQALEQLRVTGIQEAVFLYPTDLHGSASHADEDSTAELWSVRSKLLEFLRS